jgi:hypothetical protein
LDRLDRDRLAGILVELQGIEPTGDMVGEPVRSDKLWHVFPAIDAAADDGGGY